MANYFDAFEVDHKTKETSNDNGEESLVPLSLIGLGTICLCPETSQLKCQKESGFYTRFQL